MKKLAIIIPAYKPRFLQETLDSIAKQNNHEFTVYIGDVWRIDYKYWYDNKSD